MFYHAHEAHRLPYGKPESEPNAFLAEGSLENIEEAVDF